MQFGARLVGLHERRAEPAVRGGAGGAVELRGAHFSVEVPRLAAAWAPLGRRRAIRRRRAFLRQEARRSHVLERLEHLRTRAPVARCASAGRSKKLKTARRLTGVERQPPGVEPRQQQLRAFEGIGARNEPLEAAFAAREVAAPNLEVALRDAHGARIELNGRRRQAGVATAVDHPATVASAGVFDNRAGIGARRGVAHTGPKAQEKDQADGMAQAKTSEFHSPHQHTPADRIQDGTRQKDAATLGQVRRHRRPDGPGPRDTRRCRVRARDRARGALRTRRTETHSERCAGHCSGLGSFS